MWSGPRCISTAMMRAWESRADCAVWDEPLYAHYLAETGIEHPGRDAIIAAGEVDWRRVVQAMQGPAPDGSPIFFQKHMAHHVLPHMDLSWASALRHVMLIREPAAVVSSYARSRPDLTLADVGIVQTEALWHALTEATGVRPAVVASEDVLADPEGQLRRVCARLDVPWDAAMLRWRAGPRASDGVWGSHWYRTVEASTGFGPPAGPPGDLPPHLAAIADASRPAWERLMTAR